MDCRTGLVVVGPLGGLSVGPALLAKIGVNGICQIHFLNRTSLLLLAGGRGLSLLLADHFNLMNDFRLDLHQNDLFAVGGESVVLFAEPEEAVLSSLFHLSKIRGLVVLFMLGRVLDADDHPALKTNSRLQLSDDLFFHHAEVFEEANDFVELGPVYFYDGPG